MKKHNLNQGHGLKAVLNRELGVTLSKEEQTSDWSGPLTDEQVDYAKNDVRYLHLLRAALLDKMQSADRVVDLEMDLLPVLADMYLNGVYVDADAWRERVEYAQAAANYYA